MFNKKKYIIPKIVSVEAMEDYLLLIKFDTHEEKIDDMKELIQSINYYEKLKDKNYFKNVKPSGDTVIWENGEDVCPENLYYESIEYSKFLEKEKN